MQLLSKAHPYPQTKPKQRKLVQLKPKPGPIVLVALSPVSAAAVPASLTDWSDVTQFLEDIDTICRGLKPVLTLGTQLQQYTGKAKVQLAIPAMLHTKLSAFQTETKFLYDFVDFLQIFPIFKLFLPSLAGALKDELGSIEGLDKDMSQFVDGASSLSAALQVI